MSVPTLTPEQLARALAVRDLTDPAEGRHAMQRLVDDVVGALTKSWRIPHRIVRGSRIVSVADNYDTLGYDTEAVTRDARYTRYVAENQVLRSHTTAGIPAALRTLEGCERDVLVGCPGVVYRRDAIDRLHSGTPHQLDLWRMTRDHTCTTGDLKEMIELVVGALLPGADYRVEPRVHPYTTNGLQIDVDNGGEWVEIGECGLAAVPVLERCGVRGTGLAMGLGLDRILMLRKGMSDIRLLRADDARVARQMIDLGLYRPVSSQPATARDLSLAVEADDDAETLGDRVRVALEDDAESVEAVELISTTPYDELPPVARERLGIRPGQRNVLVRVVLRHPTRTLTREEANGVRERVYAALHRGLTV